MNYDCVPTCVFTPLEYGAVGLSEEEAVRRHGADAIVVYHVAYQPLEFKLNFFRYEQKCYGKVIVLRSTDRVLGFHILAPHAGEITQGFALGIKMGATKADFDDLVGIHPTAAEVMTTLSVTQGSGEVRWRTSGAVRGEGSCRRVLVSQVHRVSAVPCVWFGGWLGSGPGSLLIVSNATVAAARVYSGVRTRREQLRVLPPANQTPC